VVVSLGDAARGVHAAFNVVECLSRPLEKVVTSLDHLADTVRIVPWWSTCIEQESNMRIEGSVREIEGRMRGSVVPIAETHNTKKKRRMGTKLSPCILSLAVGVELAHNLIHSTEI
jgi:hypothetical protein